MAAARPTAQEVCAVFKSGCSQDRVSKPVTAVVRLERWRGFCGKLGCRTNQARHRSGDRPRFRVVWPRSQDGGCSGCAAGHSSCAVHDLWPAALEPDAWRPPLLRIILTAGGSVGFRASTGNPQLRHELWEIEILLWIPLGIAVTDQAESPSWSVIWKGDTELFIRTPNVLVPRMPFPSLQLKSQLPRQTRRHRPFATLYCADPSPAIVRAARRWSRVWTSTTRRLPNVGLVSFASSPRRYASIT